MILSGRTCLFTRLKLILLYSKSWRLYEHDTDLTRSAPAGVLLVMLAATAWGTVGVATKAIYGMTVTNALSIGFFRLALSLPILLLLGWLTLGRRLFWVGRKDLGWMLLMGGLTAIYQVCFFAAIARTNVTIATLITLCTAPVLVVAYPLGGPKNR